MTNLKLTDQLNKIGYIVTGAVTSHYVSKLLNTPETSRLAREQAARDATLQQQFQNVHQHIDQGITQQATQQAAAAENQYNLFKGHLNMLTEAAKARSENSPIPRAEVLEKVQEMRRCHEGAMTKLYDLGIQDWTKTEVYKDLVKTQDSQKKNIFFFLRL